VITNTKGHLGNLPEERCADAGYGSEENYQLLEAKRIQTYVKYNYFYKDHSKTWQEASLQGQNLYYNSQQDCYYCPTGQAMTKVKEGQCKTANGFIQQLIYYQARNPEKISSRVLCTLHHSG